jgi:type II secretory pathway pseudopilin PulG
MRNYNRHNFFGIRHFGIRLTFDIRASSFRAGGAFTILELLVVMTIIIVLAGLILATFGYVQKKGARSRAEAEIAAMSTALESYKADNGIYPTNNDTNNLNPADANPLDCQNASRYLYTQVSGDSDGDPTTSTATDTKNYVGSALRPNMLSPNPAGPNTYIRDPFGNSYGYSTAKALNPGGSIGYNSTFDLWSTANANPPSDQNQWIKNW